ncbi:hypothetical protein AB0J68_24000 [Micromonospora sp. NPDC049580]|uniref:hypothetical protein n=1 Tax=Micromonospora sp. NPDC049580 TaxID=3154832 RepID=UPI0034484E5D
MEHQSGLSLAGSKINSDTTDDSGLPSARCTDHDKRPTGRPPLTNSANGRFPTLEYIAGMAQIALPSAAPMEMLLGALPGQDPSPREPGWAWHLDLLIEAYGSVLLVSAAAKRRDQAADLLAVHWQALTAQQSVDPTVGQMHSLADRAKAPAATLYPDHIEDLKQPPPWPTLGPF